VSREKGKKFAAQLPCKGAHFEPEWDRVRKSWERRENAGSAGEEEKIDR